MICEEIKIKKLKIKNEIYMIINKYLKKIKCKENKSSITYK